MKRLKLPQWDTSQLRQPIRELSTGNDFAAGLLGSVKVENPNATEAFLNAARKKDISILSNFNEFGGDIIYAVLLNRKDRSNTELLLIESPEDMAASEKLILQGNIGRIDFETTTLDPAKQAAVDEVLGGKPSITVRGILASIFKFR